MLHTTAAILFLLLGGLWSFIHFWRRRADSLQLNFGKNDCKLPPGPRSLPIIGNLHMLGNLPHRSLQKAAKKYGPIMFIRLGYVPTIVVSSPQAAELFLKTHDTIFASRPKLQASEYMSYGTKGMAFTEYGPYWRNVRKLCTLELFTASKIDSFEPMRREELAVLVESVKRSAAALEVVDVSTKVLELNEDLTCRMVFGRCKDDRFDLKGIIQEALRLSGAFNISDYVPWLGPLDLQGLTRRMKAISRDVDKIFETIINEHEQDMSEHQRDYKDFTDLLLSLMNKSMNSYGGESYTIDRPNVKAIMLDMVAGSMDTSATAILWIFLELLKHPRVMIKLQAELESVVGLSKMVQEIDLAKLNYLYMVIKESLRLHPVAPLLIPHESMEDTTINKYYIPKKSRIIINTWAIGRDPELWSDNAEEFYPERFESNGVDLRGHDFQLLPFGSGRRGCPGMQLGLTMVRIVVAQLVHCFDWELPNGKLPNELDVTEEFGLTVPPANKVVAIPTYRLHV